MRVLRGWWRTGLAAVLIAALCAVFLPIALSYARPMSDQIFDFSVLAEDGEEWGGMNGWRVYVQDGAEKTDLTPDGFGGFTGLAYTGQTIYFSRALTEELPDPMLEVGAVNRSVAVFLDGTLIYTDCPEQGGGIGTLTLPMQDWDRMEPVRVSLPTDYTGKTLTIAQSTLSGGMSEKQVPDEAPTVWPCDVELYCGFAAESGYIAQAVGVSYPAMLLLLTAAALLGLFVYATRQGRLDWGLLCLAMVFLLLMARTLYLAPFTSKYFPAISTPGAVLVDPVSLTYRLLLTALLLTLTLRGKRCRIPMLLLTLLEAALSVGYVVMSIRDETGMHVLLREWPSVPLLLAALALAAVEWRGASAFFARFCKTFLTGAVLYGAYVCVAYLLLPDAAVRIRRQWAVSLDLTFQLQLLTALFLAGTLWATVAGFAAEQGRRRAEVTALRLREQMARSSYENIRRQYHESAMLRHDLNKHLSLVGTMLSDGAYEKARAYVADVAEQARNVRLLVSTGNYTVDAVCNDRLSAAEEAGVRVTVKRAEAPAALPLSDAEVCSLLLNALDNAVEAARSSGGEPWLTLDMHCKDRLFYLCVENARGPASDGKTAKKEAVQTHGFGLTIMERITEKYGGIMEKEQEQGLFRLTFVLPAGAGPSVGGMADQGAAGGVEAGFAHRD